MIPIWIENTGGLGNRIFQYMFSKCLESLVPGAHVVNANLSEFRIVCERAVPTENMLTIPRTHLVDVLEIAHLLRTGVYDGVRMGAFAQRLEYYPDRNACADLFPPVARSGSLSFDDDTLVVNVRGAEVLGDVHADYGPVPVEFFSQVAESSGLTPVLAGQLGDDPYSMELRRRFAGCRIIESVSPISDFEVIRAAKNIVFGVSTFSWLGSWLSSNTKQIHMPISGIFNPEQRPDIDLIPIGDERYTFYSFPVEKWKASPEQLSSLLRADGSFPKKTVKEIREKRRRSVVDLAKLTQQADLTELAMLRDQRARLERALKAESMELRALREGTPQ